MSTHNIHFPDKIRTFTQTFVSWTYRKNFIGTQKRVRMIHGKRAIGVRAMGVLLYLHDSFIRSGVSIISLISLD